jgi:transcription elongation factor Elf1
MKKKSSIKIIFRKCPSCGGEAETIGFLGKGKQKGIQGIAGWNCPHCGLKKEADITKLEQAEKYSANLSLI